MIAQEAGPVAAMTERSASVNNPIVKASNLSQLQRSESTKHKFEDASGLHKPNNERIDRKKNNRSTYIERSLFGTAIDSIFGSSSLFSALEDPRPAKTLDEETKEAGKDGKASETSKKRTDKQKGNRFSRSLDRRKHSRSETC